MGWTRGIRRLAVAATIVALAGSAAWFLNGSDRDDLLARADGLVRSGDADEATRVYEQLLASHPADAPALKRLAAARFERLGSTYAEHGLIDRAERCWRQAGRWDPENADVCLDLGRLALRRRRWEEAVAHLKRAEGRSSEVLEPYYSLSQAYRMLGDPAEAERYRQMADERRRTQPPRNVGMGADVGPAGAMDAPTSDPGPLR